jgi:hypothetical protein
MSLWRRIRGRIYTAILLTLHSKRVREHLLTDPHLYNARHYFDQGEIVQCAVMAIHYNTMVDRRAMLTPEHVLRLLTPHFGDLNHGKGRQPQ